MFRGFILNLAISIDRTVQTINGPHQRTLARAKGSFDNERYRRFLRFGRGALEYLARQQWEGEYERPRHGKDWQPVIVSTAGAGIISTTGARISRSACDTAG